MEKTKLGVSVAAFGAFMFVAAGVGGFVPAVILAGYVLLMESNEWLRKTAVKALATLAVFNFIIALVGVVPDALGAFYTITSLRIGFLTDLFNGIVRILGILKDLAFLGLAFKALNQGTIKIPVVDGIVEKYM